MKVGESTALRWLMRSPMASATECRLRDRIKRLAQGMAKVDSKGAIGEPTTCPRPNASVAARPLPESAWQTFSADASQMRRAFAVQGAPDLPQPSAGPAMGQARFS